MAFHSFVCLLKHYLFLLLFLLAAFTLLVVLFVLLLLLVLLLAIRLVVVAVRLAGLVRAAGVLVLFGLLAAAAAASRAFVLVRVEGAEGVDEAHVGRQVGQEPEVVTPARHHPDEQEENAAS